MSESDAPWPTTTPEARLTSAPDKVSVRDSLSPGTRLGEFEIVRVLGTGGFGIVYLARDHVLQRDVAIKEFMPAVLARRGDGATVSMRSSGCAETFARGLESFLSEARLLASFDHPSLVKVHRFWRSNATAYMAMQYYPGQTLKEARSATAVPPGEAWLEAFVQPILGALELLHREGVFHRDIAPDNIMMLPDGQPVLLDFGCARRVVAHGAQAFTAHSSRSSRRSSSTPTKPACGKGRGRTSTRSARPCTSSSPAGRRRLPSCEPSATSCRRCRRSRLRRFPRYRHVGSRPSTGPSPWRLTRGRRMSPRCVAPCTATSCRRRRRRGRRRWRRIGRRRGSRPAALRGLPGCFGAGATQPGAFEETVAAAAIDPRRGEPGRGAASASVPPPRSPSWAWPPWAGASMPCAAPQRSRPVSWAWPGCRPRGQP
jgi:hypothetical protein